MKTEMVGILTGLMTVVMMTIMIGCIHRSVLKVGDIKNVVTEHKVDGNNVTKEKGEEVEQLGSVYFGLNSWELSGASKDILDINVQMIRGGGVRAVRVEGHGCECGDDDYNLAIGILRQWVVKRYYRGKGINNVVGSSYSEERLIKKGVGNPDGEGCILNRRVETKIKVVR